MFSAEYELFRNRNIELKIFHFDNELRYWIKGSVGYIEFNQADFEALLVLLSAYDKAYKRENFWRKLRSYKWIQTIWRWEKG